jgi:hypothetical protein
MSGPQNGIVGGGGFGTDLPQTQIDDSQFAELQKTAKFSKTAEYKELKDYWDKKIAFYQTYLPNGKPVGGSHLSDAELGSRWREANVIIGEFEAMKGVYESAAQVVKDEATRRKRT